MFKFSNSISSKYKRDSIPKDIENFYSKTHYYKHLEYKNFYDIAMKDLDLLCEIHKLGVLKEIAIIETGQKNWSWVKEVESWGKEKYVKFYLKHFGSTIELKKRCNFMLRAYERSSFFGYLNTLPIEKRTRRGQVEWSKMSDSEIIGYINREKTIESMPSGLRNLIYKKKKFKLKNKILKILRSRKKCAVTLPKQNSYSVEGILEYFKKNNIKNPKDLLGKKHSRFRYRSARPGNRERFIEACKIMKWNINSPEELKRECDILRELNTKDLVLHTESNVTEFEIIRYTDIPHEIQGQLRSKGIRKFTKWYINLRKGNSQPTNYIKTSSRDELFSFKKFLTETIAVCEKEFSPFFKWLSNNFGIY